MPLAPVNGPRVATGGAVDPTSNTTAVTTGNPATEVPANTGWGPGTGSRVERVVGRASEKLNELVMDQLADEHTIGKTVGFGMISGTLKLAEKIALPNTDTYRDLVANDSRRAAYAKQNPNAVWVGTRALAGAQVGAPLGTAASFGFGGSVEITSIRPHTVNGNSDIAGAIKDQLKTMPLPTDFASLEKLQPVPGTEWMLRGESSARVGAGTSVSASAGGGAVGVSATVGAAVEARAAEVSNKRIKILDDGRVFVMISREDNRSLSGTLGATVGPNGPDGGIAGRLSNQAEKRVRIGASVSGSLASNEQIAGVTVLDRNNPADAAAFATIMKSSPEAAAEFIRKQGLGKRVSVGGTQAATGLNLQFGNDPIIATSTIRGTAFGSVEDAGGKTSLAQSDFGRSVQGMLPRLVRGEERVVTVRGGSVTRGTGAPERAVALTLDVKDPKMTEQDISELRRFGELMGAPLDLPKVAAGGDIGKAEYKFDLALSESDIIQLRQWTEADMQLAFANAHREISGSTNMPMWFAQPENFAWFKSEFQNATNDDPNRRDFLMKTYKEQGGGDLEKDIASQTAIQNMTRLAVEARGKPVEKWSSLLEVVGRSSSRDVRAVAVALKRLADADVANFALITSEKTISAKPQGSLAPTIAELTGPLLNPPN